MRLKEHQLVAHFVEQQREVYEQRKATFAQLHQATLDITSQYTRNATGSRQWEPWLLAKAAACAAA